MQVQMTCQAQGERHVVNRTAGLEAVEKPKTLLGKRERNERLRRGWRFGSLAANCNGRSSEPERRAIAGHMDNARDTPSGVGLNSPPNSRARLSCFQSGFAPLSRH